MYTEDDTMTPRDRISEDMLRRMLDGDLQNNNGYMWEQGSHSNRASNATMGLKGYPLASVYAPLQEFRSIYDKETALLKGTMFSELDLPFMGASIANRGGMCK